MSKGFAFLKSATVALAMIGVMFPQTRLLAEQKLPAKPAVKVLAQNTTLDVSLNKAGAFSGRAVDHSGSPIEGAKVVVKQGQVEVGQAVTDENGRFVVQNLKSGVYQVSSGPAQGTYRLWSEQTAPPSARTQGVIVLGEDGARGQCGQAGACDDDGSGLLLCCAGTILVGVAIAALVIAISANNKSDNDPAPHSP